MKKSKSELLKETIISVVGKHNADVEAGWLEGMKGLRVRYKGMLVTKGAPEEYLLPENLERYKDWNTGLRMAARHKQKELAKSKEIDHEVIELSKFEDCLCSVGSPRGKDGTIERIYRGRGRQSGQIMARIIMMDSNAVRNLPFVEIYPR
ncbi:MAG: hypothetical protein ACTS9Y_00605 [Methylophilus sp.]|uniref:hypothetical protein n=1 Tax=Methylophilus sp. TaxID=29541 RepID=UPI003FA1467F